MSFSREAETRAFWKGTMRPADTVSVSTQEQRSGRDGRRLWNASPARRLSARSSGWEERSVGALRLAHFLPPTSALPRSCSSLRYSEGKAAGAEQLGLGCPPTSYSLPPRPTTHPPTHLRDHHPAVPRSPSPSPSRGSPESLSWSGSGLPELG